LSTKKWHHSDELIPNKRYLIALRDPIERWLSGIAQYQVNSNSVNLSEEEIFETITFDDHTEQQIYFLKDIDLLSCVFVKVDATLTNVLTKWFKEQYSFDIGHLPLYNSSINDPVKLQIKQNLSNILDQNPNLMLKLKEHFRIDYELINRVKFYD
jgi:hypothetical protein